MIDDGRDDEEEAKSRHPGNPKDGYGQGLHDLVALQEHDPVEPEAPHEKGEEGQSYQSEYEIEYIPAPLGQAVMEEFYRDVALDGRYIRQGTGNGNRSGNTHEVIGAQNALLEEAQDDIRYRNPDNRENGEPRDEREAHDKGA